MSIGVKHLNAILNIKDSGSAYATSPINKIYALQVVSHSNHRKVKRHEYIIKINKSNAKRKYVNSCCLRFRLR